ncbi:MAG: hypothetical protein NZ578_17600 [Candidatus Binatia bacterium]|nr:hypothetical protein [Candidatus Binatia bacterium]
MTDGQQLGSTTTADVDPAEQIARHLVRNPSDLIDMRRLMQRFRASTADCLRAFTRLDQLELSMSEATAR